MTGTMGLSQEINMKVSKWQHQETGWRNFPVAGRRGCPPIAHQPPAQRRLGQSPWLIFLLVVLACSWPTQQLLAELGDVEGLVAALLSETPMVDDLRQLTDEIGGRPTGSEANVESVAWAAERFREAGVKVRLQSFEMPGLWLETSASVVLEGDHLRFEAAAAAMPFSIATPEAGLRAPIVDGGRGGTADFERLGAAAKGAWVLIETVELEDLEGLFREYAEATEIETRAFAAEVAGVIYMGSRPRNVLYRHNASRGFANQHPMLVMERSVAQRTLRLLRHGKGLEATVHLDLKRGPAFTSTNVIGEIRGGELADEVVVVGAHLDSWGLGTGALDNGCNVAMLIDIARQMQRLGIVPKRTVRFALWNGEEQGFYGSWAYVREQRDNLDHHAMAASFDIGSGRISGFFTGGRPEMVTAVDTALRPVAGLGPFQQVDVPVVGTDNYDFMVEGVPNLVALQESANYGPNYHARTDTFEQVDLEQLRLNAAIAAAVLFAFADQPELKLPRQSRLQIEQLIESTTLQQEMKSFGVWEAWEQGLRGRQQ